MMTYYKRLLGQQAPHSGGPTFREANDDFARMLDQQHGIFGPLRDRRTFRRG
jgi:hypothetical protein